MMDVLSGDVTEKDFAIVDVMNKIKECQQIGYNYRVYRTDDALGRPMGVMQMTMANIRRFIRDGDVIAIDVQSKTKNNYGWSGSYPSGWNGNNKLENYCDALTLEETDRWYAFLIISMCQISRRHPMTMKLISSDCKIGASKIKSFVPGERSLIKFKFASFNF